MKVINKFTILAALAVWIPAIASAQSYNGWLDQATCTMISGWAWDYTNNPISVDLYDGSIPLATVVANQFNPGLVSAGIGNGYHAFSIPTPASLKDGTQHLVYAKYAGTNIGLNLSGNVGPNCSAPAAGYQPYYQDNLTSIDTSKWELNGTVIPGSSGITSGPTGRHSKVKDRSAGRHQRL